MSVQTLALLATMLGDPGADWYGTKLAELAGLKSGTIYPALARLEACGWLVSVWEEVDPAVVGRPRRRIYRLTPDGCVAARERVEEHLARLGVRAAPRGRRAPLRPAGQPT